jgi:hypothetical protein
MRGAHNRAFLFRVLLVPDRSYRNINRKFCHKKLLSLLRDSIVSPQDIRPTVYAIGIRRHTVAPLPGNIQNSVEEKYGNSPRTAFPASLTPCTGSPA